MTSPLLFAALSWENIGPVLGLFLLIIVLLAVVFYVPHLAVKSLSRIYDGLEMHTTKQPGDVVLIYHTYHGDKETEHRVNLPPGDAYLLLGRLLRFNLSYGLCSHHAVLIPLLALGNYYAQQTSIARQEEMLAFANQLHGANSTLGDPSQVTSSPATPEVGRLHLGYNAMGCLSAGLAVAMLPGMLVLIITEKSLGAAVGAIVFIGFFGWIARSWIGRRHEVL